MEQIETILDTTLVTLEKKHSKVSSPKLKSADELKELLIDYAPNKQYILCRNKELCYFGTAPTLAVLNRDYDPIAAQAFLVPQLTNIAEFSNCKQTLSPEQIRECANIIATEYYYLKVTELMLFCYKFKCGAYGQFYGSVSPMVIMVSLRQFIRERNDAYYQHECKEREREEKESRKRAISAKEFYEGKSKLIIEYFNAIVKTIESIISLTIKKNGNNDKD